MSRSRRTGALLALLLGAGVLAADDKPPDKAPSRAEQFKAITAAYEKANNDVFAAYRKAKTDDERRAALKKMPKPDEYAAKVFKLVEEDPKDDLAADMLVWLVRANRSPEYMGRSLDLLAEHHIKSPKIKDVCQFAVYYGGLDAPKFLKRVLEQSPDRASKGMACFALAQLAMQRGGKEGSAEAERLFERVQKDFADVKASRGTLGEAAENSLFEIRNLAIGKVTPEIEGEDVDGKKFKLSDYRGKVVLLDFWGNW